MAKAIFRVVWNEDSGATILGRITARDATGAATGKDGEGNWLKQQDISTITCKVFDLNGATPDTAIATPTVTITDSVLDTPITTNVIWTVDTIGYNFAHDLAASNFPTGNHTYRVEYKVTLTGGTIFHGVFEGVAQPLRGS